MPLLNGNLRGRDKQPPSSGVGLTEHKKLFFFLYQLLKISVLCILWCCECWCLLRLCPSTSSSQPRIGRGCAGGSAARWERDEVEMGFAGWVLWDPRRSAAQGRGGG